jgi:hypothetical protein
MSNEKPENGWFVPNCDEEKGSIFLDESNTAKRQSTRRHSHKQFTAVIYERSKFGCNGSYSRVPQEWLGQGYKTLPVSQG